MIISILKLSVSLILILVVLLDKFAVIMVFVPLLNPGADLEHNLGGGQEHARGTGRASGGRCPLLRAKRGSFDFFLVQNAHLIMIIIVTKNTHSVLQLN